MTTPSLLELLCSLADPSARVQNATRIAHALGAEELIIFLQDPDIMQFLPAAGFPQTLPNAKAWQSFLRSGLGQPHFSGELATGGSTKRIATGISYQNECILVLIGGDPKPDAKSISPLLPMLSALLHREQSRHRYNVQLKLAEDTTAKAQELAGKLDLARLELQAALSARDTEIKMRKLSEQALSNANSKLMRLNQDLQAKQDKLDRTENLLDNLLMQSRSYDK